MANLDINFRTNAEQAGKSIVDVRSQLQNLRAQELADENKAGANIGAIRTKYHAQYVKLLKEIPEVRQGTYKEMMSQVDKLAKHEETVNKYLFNLKKTSLESERRENEKLTSAKQRELDKQASAFQKVINDFTTLHKKHADKVDSDNQRNTKTHSQELEKQEKAEAAHALKVLKFHNMLVKNSAPQGDNSRGFREMLSAGINASGIGGGFNNLASFAGGAGTTMAAASAIASVGLVIKSSISAQLELQHELKHTAIGYQTLGLSAKEAFLAARMDEGLIANEADKFGILSSELRKAEAAYLNFGGSSDHLKNKLELIVGLMERKPSLGFEEAGEMIARIMNPEVAGRIAASLNISADAFKNARTEAERYALINGVLKGTIQGVADQSQNLEGDMTRTKDVLTEVWRNLGAGTLQVVKPGTDALKFFGDAVQFVSNGFSTEAAESERNRSEQEKQIQKRKEVAAQILNQKVALEELIQAYDKEGSSISVAYKASMLRYEQLKSSGHDSAAEMELTLGKAFASLEKLRTGGEETWDILTGKKESKKEKGGKSPSVDNPLKAAQTRFELHAIEMKWTKEQIEIGLLEIQIKYDHLIAEQAKKGSDIQVDHLLSAAHAEERIREIKLAAETKFLEAVKKGKEIEDKFEEEIAHKQIELNKEVNKIRAEGIKQSNDELSKLMSERLDILSDELKAEQAETKKYTDLAKKSMEDLLSPFTDKINSLFDKLPKGIGTFASGIMKIGIDNIGASLFKTKKDEKTNIDTAFFHIVNASLIMDLPKIGAPNADVPFPPNGGSMLDISADKRGDRSGTHFRDPKNLGVADSYNLLKAQFDEAEKKRYDKLKEHIESKEEDNGEITQGAKDNAFRKMLREIHIAKSKFSISEGLHIGHGGESFATHATTGFDPFSFGEGDLPNMNEAGKRGIDWASAGKALGKGFTDSTPKDFAKGILSLIPGGGIISGIGSLLGLSHGIDSVPQYYNRGTPSVRFMPRGTDTVPAMLTPGERVLSTSQNQEITTTLKDILTATKSRIGVQINPYNMSEYQNQSINQSSYFAL